MTMKRTCARHAAIKMRIIFSQCHPLVVGNRLRFIMYASSCGLASATRKLPPRCSFPHTQHTEPFAICLAEKAQFSAQIENSRRTRCFSFGCSRSLSAWVCAPLVWDTTQAQRGNEIFSWEESSVLRGLMISVSSPYLITREKCCSHQGRFSLTVYTRGVNIWFEKSVSLKQHSQLT